MGVVLMEAVGLGMLLVALIAGSVWIWDTFRSGK